VVSLLLTKGKETIAMHVQEFLHKLLGFVIHKARIKVLSEVISAAICVKQLRLSSLGRAIKLPIQERSGIQKVNRLLGNEHLLQERSLIQKEVAHLLINTIKRPLIIVDWSKYPNSNDGIMRASLCTEGRSLTLYEERDFFKKMGNKKFQKQYLENLRDILPEDCHPIVITDAGFHNDWFKNILKFGWDYVGRIRNVRKYRPLGEKEFKHTKSLFKQATVIPKCLGKMQLTEENPLICHFYLMKSKLKGRKALRRDGKVRKDKDSKAYAKSYREPWLLVSSLSGRNAAKKIMKIYKKRMTIEEAFRDLKSNKYGFGLNEGTTKKKHRRDILLLIAMLAGLIAWLTGRIGEKMNLQYQFQSNSIKNRRVLSFFYLGCRIITKKIKISLSEIWEVFATPAWKNEVAYA
jgi:hypothetical protein